VLAQDAPVVHPVQVVPGEHEHEVPRGVGDDAQVLAHGVGRPLEPALLERRLLRGEDLQEAAREDVELVGPREVPVQRGRVELRQDEDALHPGADRVAHRDVDQPVLARERQMTTMTSLSRSAVSRMEAQVYIRGRVVRAGRVP
jgi:hypothetical protein